MRVIAKGTVFLVLLVFSGLLCFSQSGNDKQSTEKSQPQLTATDPGGSSGMTVGQVQAKAGSNYRGTENIDHSTMYLFPEWKQGYVVLNDGGMIDDILIRYDLYHQQMQFVREGDTLAFSSPEELKYLSLDGMKFIYLSFDNKGAIDKGYFEVIHDGECMLLQRRVIKYHYSDAASSQTEYACSNEYYVRKENRLAKPVTACKKSVLCVFSDREEEIKAFMKSNDLKMKSCEELKKVVEFYDSLL